MQLTHSRRLWGLVSLVLALLAGIVILSARIPRAPWTSRSTGRLVRKAELAFAKSKVEDLAHYADRVIVLRQVQEAFLRERAAGGDESLVDSLQDLHNRLLGRLFPYLGTAVAPRISLEEFSSQFSGRGIVIPSGNDQFKFALHLIATLKHVHRTILPILVVYSGPDDLTPAKRAAIESVHPDVRTMDMLHLFDEEIVGILNGGWAIKVFAVLGAPFKEVIFCDADAVFLQDPVLLFDDPGYQKTGTLFFRDREIFGGKGDVHRWWEKITRGRKPTAELRRSPWWMRYASREEMESGVVVVDKSRMSVLYGLLFAGYLSTRKVRDDVMYKKTYGDKESWWMAFELVQVPYHFNKPYASLIGELTPFHRHPPFWTNSANMTSEHHLHLNWAGRPFWWNGSLYSDKRAESGRRWLNASHWAYGTTRWECAQSPWTMIRIPPDGAFAMKDSPERFDLVVERIRQVAEEWSTKYQDLL